MEVRRAVDVVGRPLPFRVDSSLWCSSFDAGELGCFDCVVELIGGVEVERPKPESAFAVDGCGKRAYVFQHPVVDGW